MPGITNTPSPAGRKRIMVVDDSQTVRAYLRRELEPGDFDLVECTSGEEAMARLGEIAPHLVTLDLEMGGIDGHETCARIRAGKAAGAGAGLAGVPVILVTGKDSPDVRRKGFAAGATDFIQKPVMKGELLRLVSRLLHPERQAHRVLVVDDSAPVLHMIAATLRADGLCVTTAASGVEAVGLFARGESFDLVLLDYLMEGLDGEEVCRRIREDLGYRSLPVLLLSSRSDAGTIVRMLQAGASDYLVKPFVKEELLARIRVHLRGADLTRDLESKVADLKKLNTLKGEILSVAAHDLRSPLNGILGFSDLLQQEGVIEEAERREFARHIHNSGTHLLHLIEDILSLGRLDAEGTELDLQELDLVPVLQGAVETVSHAARPKRIAVVNGPVEGGSAVVRGDRTALLRVFNNLLSNAVKFTPDGGRVDVLVVKAPDQVRVVVRDTGIGIPADKLPSLFDRFTKLSRPGTRGERSTGLGMAITKELVERHAGSVEVQSEEGKGSRFTVAFPLLGG